MKQLMNRRLLPAFLGGGLALFLMLPTVAVSAQLSNPEGWIDKLTAFVLFQKANEKEGAFDPYLGQVKVMQTALREEWAQGELRRTYVEMNRLMDMLLAREGGIRPEAAQAIWDFCYQVTPVALHNGHRYPRTLDLGNPEKPKPM